MNGPQPVGELARDFPVSRPAISQHLRVLADAQLVRQHKSGRNNFYTLDTTGLAALREGARISDVSHAVQEVAEPAGFALVREYGGHGVGRALHEDPMILNYGRPGRGPVAALAA